MPITKKDEDMPKWGWVKKITYEKLTERNGLVYLQEWYFFATDNQCLHCKQNDRLWLWIPSHNYLGGVFMGCSRCGRVYGPLGFDDYASSKSEPRRISLQEMAGICRRTKQPVPTKRLAQQLSKLGMDESKKSRKRPPKVGEEETEQEAKNKD